GPKPNTVSFETGAHACGMKVMEPTLLPGSANNLPRGRAGRIPWSGFWVERKSGSAKRKPGEEGLPSTPPCTGTATSPSPNGEFVASQEREALESNGARKHGKPPAGSGRGFTPLARNGRPNGAHLPRSAASEQDPTQVRTGGAARPVCPAHGPHGLSAPPL